jgi:hypothetical protein
VDIAQQKVPQEEDTLVGLHQRIFTVAVQAVEAQVAQDLMRQQDHQMKPAEEV